MVGGGGGGGEGGCWYEERQELHKAWRPYRVRCLTCGIVVAGSQASALLRGCDGQVVLSLQQAPERREVSAGVTPRCCISQQC